METARGGSGSAAAGASGGYPDSLDSSPRSRAGDSGDDSFQSKKLRLMCSYGGQIVPRPHDKSLCYLGGDTRIVVVDRHITLAELSAKLSSLFNGHDFSLKYQIPSEDLDSLISITTEEDLDNMVEEYDRIAISSCSHGTTAILNKPNQITTAGKSSRLRLFLFPIKIDSAPSSIGSLLDDSKSETWFVDALNGAIGIAAALPRRSSADSIASSVNCLLSLGEDTIPSVPAMPVEQNHHVQSLKHNQEVHSVPDSPMMDTSSSFGSTSSAHSQLNLPHIRSDDRSPDKRGLEDHFSPTTVALPVAVNLPLPSSAITSVATPPPGSSPNENNNHGGGGKGGFSSDDDNLDQLMTTNPPQPPLPQQLKLNGTFDKSIPARPVYYPEKTTHVEQSDWNNTLSDYPKQEVPHESDSQYMVRSQVSEQSNHVWPQQQHQQHYIHPDPQSVQHHRPSYQNPQLLPHHHPSTPLVPIQSYYQIHHPIQHQQQSSQTPYISQFPLYFMPVPQNSPYTLSMPPHMPPNLVDGTIMSCSSSSPSLSLGKPVMSTTSNPIPLPRGIASPQKHPELPATNIYRTSSTTSPQPSPPPQLINMNENAPQFISNYPPMYHSPLSQAAPPYTQRPVYYAQAASSPLPSQFHMTSSTASTIISDAQIQPQKPDLKQTRAAS